MSDDAMAYLKAVDKQRQIGSNASTATGGCSIPPSKNSLAHTPLARLEIALETSLKRTRLTSQAKPFVSSGLFTGALTHMGWMPTVVNVRDGSSQQGCSQMQVYTGEALYVFSNEEPACKESLYCETLQEEIYAGEETVERGRPSTRDERMVIQSRTPSPTYGYAAPLFPNIATAAASWRLYASENLAGKVDEANNRRQDLQAEGNPSGKIHNQTSVQHPVKHTFIHYDDGQPKRFVKSASSPSILLHNVFHVRPMSELHELGRCSPCLYFRQKGDGCRQGSDCRFCHMCTPDEIKKHRKTKVKESRARKRALALQNVAASSLTLSEETKDRVKCGGRGV